MLSTLRDDFAGRPPPPTTKTTTKKISNKNKTKKINQKQNKGKTQQEKKQTETKLTWTPSVNHARAPPVPSPLSKGSDGWGQFQREKKVSKIHYSGNAKLVEGRVACSPRIRRLSLLRIWSGWSPNTSISSTKAGLFSTFHSHTENQKLNVRPLTY